MEIGVTLFIMAILIIAIWVIVEVKRLRHKLFAVFLIILILFTYFSFTFALRDKNVDLTKISGLVEAGGLYINWLGYMLQNIKSISTYAFKKDWGVRNETFIE